jgi:hypothetical protein
VRAAGPLCKLLANFSGLPTAGAKIPAEKRIKILRRPLSALMLKSIPVLLFSVARERASFYLELLCFLVSFSLPHNIAGRERYSTSLSLGAF